MKDAVAQLPLSPIIFLGCILYVWFVHLLLIPPFFFFKEGNSLSVEILFS